MESNKVFLIVFVCVAVVFPVEQTSATFQHDDEGPCDTCPFPGICMPKVCCPAHMRSDSSNPECHMMSGQIGVCCYTGRHQAIKNDLLAKTQAKVDELMQAHSASKAKWLKWSKKSQSLLEHGKNTIVSPGSPEYGHQLSFAKLDKEAEKLGAGALLNLFAVQDLKKRLAIDDDELASGYSEKGPYCPPLPTCPDQPSIYRSVNGECNNPDHPTWGAANSGYERLLPPDYSDGIWALRTSKCDPGEPLPSPRTISTAVLPDGDYPSPSHNMMFSQFCQFMAHDVSSAVMFTIGNGSSISCCTKDGHCLPPDQLHMACAPIAVDPKDEFFSCFNRTCLNFVRVQLAPSPDCSCGYAKQMNGVSHFLDLSHLYGKSVDKQNTMRAPGGYMKVFNDYGRELPPLTDRPECFTNKDQAVCFDSGDHHGNQLITLTALHTIFTREHNRIVRELTRLNPNCDEDAIFNTAKRLLQAMYQHIVYNEWLPLIIGPERMHSFNLAACDGYSTSYDPEVNPSTLVEFTSAVMRFAHSTVDAKVRVGCPRTGKTKELIAIQEVMFEPGRLRMKPFLDDMTYGITMQPMQCVDPFITHGLTRFMFRRGNPFGLDLASLDVQRGRDFGLQPYNEYRRLVGLKPIEKFSDFPPSTRKRLSSVYCCPKDIDLCIGGLLEEPVKGGIVGPTFACIIAEQFSRAKVGDRYHYEHGPDVNPGAFTPCQLEEIKKSSMARILCDNVDGKDLTSMPPSAFLRGDLPENTPLQCCGTSIPSVDLSKFEII